jgi:hypothetical protein
MLAGQAVGLRLPDRGTRDTVITLAGSSACSCYYDTTPRFEQKRVDRAREGNIGGSSGTGGPSGVIAQTDLFPGPWPIAVLSSAAGLAGDSDSRSRSSRYDVLPGVQAGIWSNSPLDRLSLCTNRSSLRAEP